MKSLKEMIENNKAILNQAKQERERRIMESKNDKLSKMLLEKRAMYIAGQGNGKKK